MIRAWRGGDGQCDHGVGLTGAERGGQRNRQKNAGEGHQPVHHAHQPGIKPPPPACGQPHHAAGEGGARRHRQPDAQRHPRAEQDAAQHIAAETIGAEPVDLVRRAQPVAIIVLHRIERRQPAGQQRRQQNDADQCTAEQQAAAQCRPQAAAH